MVQTIPAAEVTLRELKQAFGLQQAQDPNFFVEWSETHAALSEGEQQLARSRQSELHRVDGRPTDAGKQRQDGGAGSIAGSSGLLSQAVSD